MQYGLDISFHGEFADPRGLACLAWPDGIHSAGQPGGMACTLAQQKATAKY